MKKLKIIFIVAAIIFALVIVFVAMAALYMFFSGHTTTQYVDYQIVDDGLLWKNPNGLEWGKYEAEYRLKEEYPISKIQYRYQRIPDESNDKFIGAWIAFGDSWGYSFTAPTVLVHPDHKFDVWCDWHINKIEIYQNLDEVNLYPDDKFIRVVASSEDGEIISELIERRLENNQGHQTITPDMPDITKYYIRLSFDESESIVWAARIEIYNGKIILECGKLGMRLHEYDSDNEVVYNMVIPSGTPLYDFIMDAIS